MQGGEGLLAIPWLGPLIFQIRKQAGRKQGPAWSPILPESQRLVRGGDRRGRGGLLARAGPSRMLGPELLSPTGRLRSSKAAQTIRGKRPTGESAAAAQAAGTCEKFVKGDERKGEEGEAGGCEHLARQSRQLPPRDGILSSGCPIGAISHSTPFLSPQHWKVEVGQGWRWEGGSCWLLPVASAGSTPGAGPDSEPLEAWRSEKGVKASSPRSLRPWAWVVGKLVQCRMLVSFQHGLGSQIPGFQSPLYRAYRLQATQSLCASVFLSVK